MLPSALDGIVSDLEQSGVRWCVLDASSAEPHLLVDPAQARLARSILVRHGLRVPHSDAGDPAGAADTYVTSDVDVETGHTWLQVRVSTELSYGPYGVLLTRAEHACLQRRQRQDGHYVLHPDDQFWTHLLHTLLDEAVATPGERMRLQEMASRACADGPLARALALAGPPNQPIETVLGYAQRGDWPALMGYGRALQHTWGHHRRLSAPHRRFTRHLRNAFERLTLRHRTGLTVALLGPDGCGKSTVAGLLADSYFAPVRLVYMGLWQRTEGAIRQPRVPGASLAGRLMKLWRGYLAGQYHRAMGRLVIFDRYAYDARLPADGTPSAAARLYNWLLGHACPGPDLALLLDAPGEVMYARKHESTAARLEAERQAFLSLRSRVSTLDVVDATRPLPVVCGEVTRRIFRRTLDRGH